MMSRFTISQVFVTAIACALVGFTANCIGQELPARNVNDNKISDDKNPAGYKPMRINKCIELLELGQPIYHGDGKGGYDEGKALAKTWADYIWYDMEHAPLDMIRLRDSMQGLVDGGPTPSGHRTPTVIVTLPVLGVDNGTMKGGSWMVQQALACGIHGVHLCRARSGRCAAVSFKPLDIRTISKQLTKSAKGCADLGVTSLRRRSGEGGRGAIL